MWSRSLFNTIDSIVDEYIKENEKLQEEQRATITRYAPESFDTTVVRKRIKFERINNNSPLFKDTMMEVE